MINLRSVKAAAVSIENSLKMKEIFDLKLIPNFNALAKQLALEIIM